MTLLFKVCFSFFLFSSLFAFPRVNFHLTDQSHHAFEHHCFPITASYENVNNTEEVISLCVTHPLANQTIQTNSRHEQLTFDDLRKQNVTGEQLYQWSASIDLIEQYQFYLTSNHSILSNSTFYNCTSRRFGPQCEFEFVYVSDDQLTLDDVILQFYQMSYQWTSLTCYVHLQCDRGSKFLCLDWSEICDGYVDCINDQIDEKFCWELQINECEKDQYRCRNGQCISKQFALDNSKLPACLDQSDNYQHVSWKIYQDPHPPMLQIEDSICVHQYQIYPSSPARTSSCNAELRNLFGRLGDVEIPDTLSNLCFLTFHCTFYIEIVDFSICKDVCDHQKCSVIINETCPELIITTAVPIAFSHIYVGYLRQSNDYSTDHDPDYICYDEKLCTGFRANAHVIAYKNRTCHRTADASIQFEYPVKELSTFRRHVHSVHKHLAHCNTIVYDGSNVCNGPFVYRCQNSSKCISISRLCDQIEDCEHDDDENCTLSHGKCSPMDTSLLFKCPLNAKCISWNRVRNGRCDCPSPYSSMSTSVCEDEPYSLCDPDHLRQCQDWPRNSYITTVISFPTICDGFQELFPILVDGTNHTDETECQYWQCNNSYTRCNGFWNCLDGADEVGCNEYPLINCPLHHHACIQLNTFELICLPLDKANDGSIECLGATDEVQLCRSIDYKVNTQNFYCDLLNHTRCVGLYDICQSNCINENADLFCHLSNLRNSWDCSSANQPNSSYLVKYLCSRPVDQGKNRLGHFSLTKRVSERLEENTQRRLVREKTFTYDFQCHHGYPLRRWLDDNQTQNEIVCLCPPSYYGNYCQYQNQRVSLTLQFQTYSDSRRTLFTVVILLMDNSSERIIHSSKQLTYVYIKHCQTKFNFYLTYSTRPKDSSRTYYVRLDVYEKFSFGYQGSLRIPLDLPFLPVHRVAYVLNLPRNNYSLIVNCPKGQMCLHGQCRKYAETLSNLTFCYCHQGWSGKDCSVRANNTCSSDSLFVAMEVNNRSICLCPLDKWGPRCYLQDTICQSGENSTCLNNAQCIPIADRGAFICLCPRGFSGDRCEIEDAKIIVSFDEDIALSEVMLVHFIEVRKDAPVRTGSTFQSIPLYHRVITVRWSRPFHLVFTEFSNKTFYLISVQENYNQSQVIEKFVTASDRCGRMNDYVNRTILDYPLIRRMKYYHLPCQNRISCFYDQEHFCICNDFGSQRIANCFPFNSTLSNNCFKLSNCENGGQCLQDDDRCPQTSRCVCHECFYGALCQFSSSLFDLSLDGIIGSHIRPSFSIHQQPPIIKTTLAFIFALVITGLINGILSLIAFRSKETRQVGCGYYLFGSTITTLLTSIMLALKFSILLLTQMKMIHNRTFLNIQCYSLDYFLQICLNLDRWFNGCVAIERAFNIIQGIHFNKNRSITVAKRVISILLFVIIASAIYDPLHRRSVDDDSNDEEKRVWCIVSYSSTVLSLNQLIHMFHFFVPFLMNIISAFIIIILSTERGRKIRKDVPLGQILREEMEHHRHLLISPFVLVVLSLPRLIISFVSGCMQSNHHPWMHLIGYLISFIPPMLTFVIFVLPSKLYQDEFRKQGIRCIRR